MSQNSLTALVEALDKAILGLNPLTGYGEDAVWRPADKARTALIKARTAIINADNFISARQALASITPEEGTPDHIADAGKMIAATLPEREAVAPDVWREKVARTLDAEGVVVPLHYKGSDYDFFRKVADAIASISVQDRRGSVGEEDLGSVGPLAAPSVPSPSLSDEPATPCDEYVSRETAEFLWDLLDDIDTVSDIAKGNDGRYRRLVEPIQARRFLVGKSDGYRIKFGRFEGCAIKPEADGEASKREARGRPNTDLPPSQGEPES